ncbi:hypothetical protein C8Q80DRAFT_1109884, partial [Daedaleopsis nitida]
MCRQRNQAVPTCEKGSFPPPPLTNMLEETIVREYAEDVAIDNFLESACCVCGMLTPRSKLQNINEMDIDLTPLVPAGPMTRRERFATSDPIVEIPGPVKLPECSDICIDCLNDIGQGKMPSDSLANGLWIGEILPQLKDLSWTEKMLISRVKHNICIVKVHVSGMSKMKANVVSHSLPMPKIYRVLPPAREDLDEVLAFIYIGPNVPTHKEFKRTPMLVHRNKVKEALEWLKLNHSDYADLDISYSNSNEYFEDEPPVIVNYTQSMESNKDPEATAVNDTEEDEGIEEGDCPFIVHGLTGTNLNKLGEIRPYEITARAV